MRRKILLFYLRGYIDKIIFKEFISG